MEGKSNQFLFSFIFDVFFFSVCVCIWLYIRKNRDENKINDNIYILSQSTDSDAKSGRDSGVKTTEIGKAKKKSATFRTFLNIKDDKIVNTEIKFYLFFLKTNRNIVFSLCVLGTFLVLPVYLYLPRNDLSNPSLLNYISAGSISDTNVMAILFFITLIYSAIAYAFIYLLWKRVKPNKEKAKSFLPQNFTIMVSNIDRDDVNAYNIYKYFCNLTNNKVVSVFLILDYSVLFGLQKKILNATNKLKMLKENEEKKKNREGKESSHNIFQIFWKEKKKKKKDSIMIKSANIMKQNAKKMNVIASGIFMVDNKNSKKGNTDANNKNNNDSANMDTNTDTIIKYNNATGTTIPNNNTNCSNYNISNNSALCLRQEKNGQQSREPFNDSTTNVDHVTRNNKVLLLIEKKENVKHIDVHTKKDNEKRVSNCHSIKMSRNNRGQKDFGEDRKPPELNGPMGSYTNVERTNTIDVISGEFINKKPWEKDKTENNLEVPHKKVLRLDESMEGTKENIDRCLNEFFLLENMNSSEMEFAKGEDDEEKYKNLFSYFSNIFKKRNRGNKSMCTKLKQCSKRKYDKQNNSTCDTRRIFPDIMESSYKQNETDERITHYKKKSVSMTCDDSSKFRISNGIAEKENLGNSLLKKKVLRKYSAGTESNHSKNKYNTSNNNNIKITYNGISKANNKGGDNFDIGFETKQNIKENMEHTEESDILKFSSDEDETLSEEKINKKKNYNPEFKGKHVGRKSSVKIQRTVIQKKRDGGSTCGLKCRKTELSVDHISGSTSQEHLRSLSMDSTPGICKSYMNNANKKKKQYWKKELKENVMKFYELVNETPKKSTGVCFVSFIDTKSVHDCIHNIPYNKKNNNWIISEAPPNYDIIWKNLKNPTYKICARFVILNALLLLINIIIITVVSSIDKILNVREKQSQEEKGSNGSSFSVVLTAWFSPFIVIFVNSIIQPVLITCVSIMIGFIRKSSEHNYVLKGNFMFLILNTIIIPLLSVSPLNAFLKLVYEKEMEKLSEQLGAILFNSSGFFAMRYILHCYFLTCANQLLQIPQFSMRSIYEKITKKETETWTFDFGYWYAFNTSMLALILTFSVTVPLILPLGSLYFFLRYYIDKYNLIYEICRTNLDSQGAVVKTAINFMLFSVAFFQAVMFGFFFRVQNKFIAIGRNILFLTSSLTFLLLLCRSSEWVRTHHIKKKKGENTFCYLCEKNVYVNSLKDLNKLKYAYANPCEANI